MRAKNFGRSDKAKCIGSLVGPREVKGDPPRQSGCEAASQLEWRLPPRSGRKSVTARY